MKIFLSFLLSFVFVMGHAHIDPKNYSIKTRGENAGNRLPCQQAEAQIDMEINNVRARLLTGGDIWWDLDRGRYIVPKPAPGLPEVSAIFAGGVWIGGVDIGNNIKLAGVTYRNATGFYDWYAGPLDKSGNTELQVCNDWDRFFSVLGSNIQSHIVAFDNYPDPDNFPCDSIPDDVKYWPGQGNPYWLDKFEFELPDQPLGAFWDENGNGIYDPCGGDFPIIDIRKCEPVNRDHAKELVPDEMKFWIYNDNGSGNHLLTRGQPIRMEVQVQAFAYATNDQVNDMTFYRYKLLNKAEGDLFNCYFAMWVDPDLGCYQDDYIGVDVDRSMAYVYNEDAVDGITGCNCSETPTYCNQVPLLGIDYFRGPRGAKKFIIENGDTCKIYNADSTEYEYCLRDPSMDTPEAADTLVEIGMTSFIYMENCSVGDPEPVTCDPSGTDLPFYNYLRGLWLDGTPITFGGSGYNPGSTDTVKYVFPNPPNMNDGWSMCTADLPFGDRRTLQATGPLVLQPGTTNELIIGVPFVPDETSYPCPDISRLLAADNIAQALFDNCFDIVDGPDAPDITGVELDRELILVLSNDAGSNNKNLTYSEKDIFANPGYEAYYSFQGYKIYQLANASVTAQELDQIDKARLVRQTDLKDKVSILYNWSTSSDPTEVNETAVYTPVLEVTGADLGLMTTFDIKEDAFGDTDNRLVNHRQYHYMALAYGFNEYEKFDHTTGLGQIKPYLEGRRNVKVYTLVPRPIVYENLQVSYGDQPVVTRIHGQGNGGNFLDISEGTRNAIVDNTIEISDNGDSKVTYNKGAGPISVKVYNPREIKDGKFSLKLIGEMDKTRTICGLDNNTTWVLTDEETNEVVASDRTIDGLNEQIIYKKGFSVLINQVSRPGNGGTNNGAIGITMEYANPSGNQWFTAVPDGGINQFLTDGQAIIINNALIDTDPIVNMSDADPDGDLSTMGAFYPFALAATTPSNGSTQRMIVTPGASASNLQILATNQGNKKYTTVQDLNNVDIVITKDRSKWSRCAVIETANPIYISAFDMKTVDKIDQFTLRKTQSVDKYGNPDESGTVGMGWFPGYAVDVETGKRLNIFFGENSVFSNNPSNATSSIPNLGSIADSLDTKAEIGSDMIWNPTSQLFALNVGLEGQFHPAQIVLGGQQFIYVTREEYDECAGLAGKLTSTSPITKSIAPGVVTWCTMPLLSTSAEMLSYEDGYIPNDLTIKLRVDSPYSNQRISDINTSNTVSGCITQDDLPEYFFDFSAVESQELQPSEYAGALSNVRIVPNPYYAYASYETGAFSNVVKITNLPDVATITIYSLDGKFIRRFDRAEMEGVNSGTFVGNNFGQTNPSVIWDLKNSKGIPVASGVYLFHIDAPELGEEVVLKWFGVNRRFDPSSL
ncbi:MAG: hypothetical protein H6572_09140 [Lewinellaceae bacterium]|nr:hypothetical protein [Lewinellaceae bacterium]